MGRHKKNENENIAKSKNNIKEKNKKNKDIEIDKSHIEITDLIYEEADKIFDGLNGGYGSEHFKHINVSVERKHRIYKHDDGALVREIFDIIFEVQNEFNIKTSMVFECYLSKIEETKPLLIFNP